METSCLHCLESFLLPNRKDTLYKGQCFQSSRLEDQRSPLPAASTLQDAEEERGQRANGKAQSGSTMPEEDLFALIQRLQAGRMEDQRASGPGKAC